MTTRDKGITLPVYPPLFIKGSCTLAAAVSTAVNDSNVTADCKIFLIPTNAAAATLIGGVKSLYVSAKTIGVSFTLATANGAAAAGTESFDYLMVF